MRVRYTLPAADDLEAVLDYIAARSPQAARRVGRRISTSLALVAIFPSIGTRTNDETIRRQRVRPYPYVIFYEIGDEEIIVHAIRHGARDPATMPGAERA